jgi:hypothetical protein
MAGPGRVMMVVQEDISHIWFLIACLRYYLIASPGSEMKLQKAQPVSELVICKVVQYGSLPDQNINYPAFRRLH